MKVLKKATSVAGIFMLLAIALVSCKNEVDVYAPLGEIADSKIPATYSCTEIDTVTYDATVYEYTFAEDLSGSKLMTRMSGKGEIARAEKAFTYKRGEMTEDHLYYDIELTYSDGTKEKVRWGAASIVDKSGRVCNGPKRADHLITIADALPNKEWKKEETELYIDTIKTEVHYMRFTSAVDYLTMHEIDSINAWMKSTEGQAAIAWWNENYAMVGGTEADKVARDTVRYSTSKTQGDAYMSQYYHWSEEDITTIDYDTIGVKSYAAYSYVFVFTEGMTNIGLYKEYKEEYTRAYYVEHDMSGAKFTDEEFPIVQWGVAFNGSLLNAKTLAVRAKYEGKNEVVLHKMSGLDAKKGTVKIDDVEYTTAVGE